MLHDPDLPDALRQMDGPAAPAFERRQSQRFERLAALGTVLAAKRDEAVHARQESGIEKVWTAAEEAYLCIDEVNRHEFTGGRWSKPTSPAGPVTTERTQPTNKSTVFVPLTPRYVDMAFAKVSEIILPVDDKPFSIDNSPIPELASKLEDTTPATAADGTVINGADGQPLTRGQLLQKTLDVAHEKAKREETWIYDRFVESNYPREMRRVLFDAARIGAGVLKGPIPTKRKSQALSIQGNEATLEVQEKIRPGVAWFDVWNLFPAPGCGEDIHEGEYLFERDYFTRRKLQDLKGMQDTFGRPMYIADAIDKVIAEGPGKVNVQAQGGKPADQLQKTNQFEVWYYYGVITADDFKNMGVSGAEDLPESVLEVHAVVTVVNDTVIRATVNPLESGKFPFRVMCWQRRAGYWAGIGVGERLKVPQSIVNGGTRAMLNNAGKSAGSQIVMDRRVITPSDGSWDLNTGDKLWELTGESLADDVRQIFMTYTIPNLTPQMLTIIAKAEQMAEQATNLPLVAQGMAGKDDPETFGQAELQNNNANVLLRSIAYAVDDSVTDPVVRDFHEWYLLDPDVPAEDKGDFEINAHGSIAMVERAIQEQVLAQMLTLTVNPVWGQNPKKVFAQFMKTKRLNPADTAYTDAEMKALQSQPPVPSPQEKAAAINAGAKLHAVEMEGQNRLQEIAAEAQHEGSALLTGGATPQQATALAKVRIEEIRAHSAERREDSRAHAEAARADRELQIAQVQTYDHLEELRLKRELALLDYANKQQLTLTQVKGQLANTALRAQVDSQLQSADHAHEAGQNAQDRAHASQERQAIATTQAQTATDAQAAGVSANTLTGEGDA